jgi:hypothetical protein
MNTGFRRQAPAARTFVIAVLLMVGIPACAKAQTSPTDPPDTPTGGTTTEPSAGLIGDKTYLSVGVESVISKADALLKARDLRNFSGLRDALRKADTPQHQLNPAAFVTALNKQLPPPLNTGGGSDAAFSAGVAEYLNRYIRGQIPSPDATLFVDSQSPRRTALDEAERSRRLRRVEVDLAFTPFGPLSNLLTIRTNLLNLLAVGSPTDITKLISNPDAFRTAIEDFKSQLPPDALNTYGVRVRTGEVKPNYLPEIAHSDAIIGYDVSLTGIAGATSGAGIAFRKDLSEARMLTAYYLRKIYDIVELIQRDPVRANDEVQEYLAKIAEEYPKMSMAPRVAAFAGYSYTNGGPATTTSSIRRASLLNVGASASWLRPFRGRGPDLQEPHSSAGIAALVSVRQLLVLPGGQGSQQATRLAASFWFQDLVPYYVAENDPTAYGDKRYVFDHWHFRIGAEIANKTRFDSKAAWNLFVRFRTLPSGNSGLPTADVLRRDTQFTLAFGEAGNTSHVVTFRLDRNF